jgi:3-hydroxyisobutyrate dehydrogenase
MRLAVLGTGIMGGAMARRLLEAGYDVSVWNRTPEKAEALGRDGARVPEAPADAVEGVDAFITMLPDGPTTEHVVREASPQAGTLWLQMGTVGVDGSERLSALARDLELTFVDAPVLGSKAQAEAGELTVLASGPEEAREDSDAVFAAFAARIFWLGNAGEGSRAKLVLNHWVLCSMEAIAETFALAEALVVDPRRFLEIIAGGGTDMAYAHLKGRMILDREFPAAFPLEVARKDLGLICDAARQAGLEPALVDAAIAKFDRAIELGHGREDMAATYYASAPAA